MEEALQNQEEAMEQEKKVKELIAANNLEGKTIKFLHKAYSMMDLDDSGEITVKELKFALDQSQLQIKESRLEMAFRVIAPDFTSVIKFAGINGVLTVVLASFTTPCRICSILCGNEKARWRC